jgi:diadenylate cyclase
VEVAAILPLSKKTDLPAYFGTRHRAAVGLAEQTDAVVIVVSEERGQVTVFKDESIIHINDNIELSKVLREHTGENTTTSGLKRQTVELGIAAMICLDQYNGHLVQFRPGPRDPDKPGGSRGIHEPGSPRWRSLPHRPAVSGFSSAVQAH